MARVAVARWHERWQWHERWHGGTGNKVAQGAVRGTQGQWLTPPPSKDPEPLGLWEYIDLSTSASSSHNVLLPPNPQQFTMYSDNDKGSDFGTGDSDQAPPSPRLSHSSTPG